MKPLDEEGLRALHARDFARAHDRFCEVLVLEPNQREALLGRALALAGLGRPLEALEIARRVLALSPGYQPAR